MDKEEIEDVGIKKIAASIPKKADETPLQNSGSPAAESVVDTDDSSFAPYAKNLKKPANPISTHSKIPHNKMPPIVLSETGWASNHPGLLELIRDHFEEYNAEMENGLAPQSSETVKVIIQQLVTQYSPKILAVDGSNEGSASGSDRPRGVPVAYEDVQVEGSYYTLMTKKVHECYICVKEDSFISAPIVSQTPESQPDSPVRNNTKASRRSHRSVRSTSAKYNPYAKAYPLSTDQQSSPEQSTTPKRKYRPKNDLDETPIVANRNRQKKSRASSSLNITFPGTVLSDSPSVRINELSYDWSSLQLDGTAVWNRLLLERVNPAITNVPKQMTAMDTYQLMQNLRNGLRPISPPKNSPVAEGADGSLSNCPEALKPVVPKLKRLVRDMTRFANHEDCTQRNSYHFKPAAAIRSHVQEIERHVTELKERSAQSATTVHLPPSRLPAILEQKKLRRQARKNSKPKAKVPPFWQENFQALLNEKSAATHHLMIQDQY